MLVLALPGTLLALALTAAQAQDEPASPAVVLDAGLRFVQTDGEEIVTEGGIYRLEAIGSAGLRLRSGEEVLEIRAEPLTLEKRVENPEALSFEDDAGIRHVVLMRDGGQALSALGRREDSVEERGTTAMSYTTVDRTRLVSTALQPTRILANRLNTDSRINPPTITVQSPAKDEMWLHGNTYEVRWTSRDGTWAKVGDKVKVRLFKGNTPVATPFGVVPDEQNDGVHALAVTQWMSPVTYHLVVESSANSAIFGKSQPFRIRVTEPCKKEGDVVDCITFWFSGFNVNRFATVGPAPSRQGGWAKVWVTEGPYIYQEAGGKITGTELETGQTGAWDDRFLIRYYSGGYEYKKVCGAFHQTCTYKKQGLISKIFYLHATPNN